MICTVAGEGGHTAEVLSIDGHLDGIKFVTSGMDDCVKIWSLQNCMERVDQSETWDAEKQRLNFPTVFLQYPLFSTKSVCGDYVDCVRWYGELIIAKGVAERIIIFKPLDLPDDLYTTSDRFTVLLEFELSPCEVWFVRFSLDFEFNILACGDQIGRIHAWDIRSPVTIKHFLLKDEKSTSVIRQTAVSLDGSIILAACDNSEVWRWDRVK